MPVERREGTDRGTCAAFDLPLGAGYDLFYCYGDSSPLAPAYANQSCVFISTSDLASQVTGGAPSTRSIISYVESILFYAGFGVAAAIFCIVFTACFCQFRCCCCCIRGGMCGKRFPTYTTRSCRLGFREVATSLLSSSDGSCNAAPASPTTNCLHAHVWLLNLCSPRRARLSDARQAAHGTRQDASRTHISFATCPPTPTPPIVLAAHVPHCVHHRRHVLHCRRSAKRQSVDYDEHTSELWGPVWVSCYYNLVVFIQCRPACRRWRQVPPDL